MPSSSSVDYAIAVRTTVDDRATITFSYEGYVASEVTGARGDPVDIVGVIKGALWDGLEPSKL